MKSNEYVKLLSKLDALLETDKSKEVSLNEERKLIDETFQKIEKIHELISERNKQNVRHIE